jgi:hypothetical protein
MKAELDTSGRVMLGDTFGAVRETMDGGYKRFRAVKPDGHEIKAPTFNGKNPRGTWQTRAAAVSALERLAKGG